MTHDARRGYSSALVEMVHQLDRETVVAKFAKYCIEHRISVLQVAEAFGVSRETVYCWFKGVYQPRPRHTAAMADILREVNRA